MRRRERLPRVAMASMGGGLLVAAVLLTTVLLTTVLLTTVLLTTVPLSGRHRAEGWVLAVALALFVPLLALAASAHRHRIFSPELDAAAIVRGIIWLPVGAVMVGAVEFAWHQDMDAAASAAAAILIGAGIALGSRFWWLSRRP